MIRRRHFILPVLLLYTVATAQVRHEIAMPNIPGYRTLKCDLHVHTVFSDGLVWPTKRVAEAWTEGLDAIAITDHIEYRPHKADMNADHNRSFQIASEAAQGAGLICIPGAEITRSMPPGHFNTLFLQDANALDTPKFLDAIQAAVDQKAFIFWNHPGWSGQQPDRVSRWYALHDTLMQRGWLHGIEVVNDRESYPPVQRWCLEKNLALMGNSDIHDATDTAFDKAQGQRRAMTLVFATEKTEQGIKDALFAGRTTVWLADTLYGRPEYLAPLFDALCQVEARQPVVKGRGRAAVSVKNSSDVPLILTLKEQPKSVTAPAQITVPARSSVLVTLKGKAGTQPGARTVPLNYTVDNLRVAAGQGLAVTLKAPLQFISE